MVSLTLSKSNMLEQRSNDVSSLDCLLWSNIKLKKAWDASVDAVVTVLF